MIPFCIDQKIAVIPWSPLARGYLTRNRSKDGNETLRAQTDDYGKGFYTTDTDFKIIKRVDELAAEKGIPSAQLALAWILDKAAITAPIIGASKPGHLEDTVAALSVKLTLEEVRFLEELYQPHTVLGFS